MRVIWIWVVIGAIVGFWVADLRIVGILLGEDRIVGLVAGAFIGAVWAAMLRLQERVRVLEGRLELAPDREPAPATASEPEPQPDPIRPSEPPGTSAPTAPPSRKPSPETPPKVRVDSPVARMLDRAKTWLVTGNVPVKVGVLVSLVGVAALLRYAADQGWLRISIEMRLAVIAMAALGALAFAWRHRHRRPGFSLALQGGAVGVLVLTVFAAFRLYDLIPAPAAFALLLVLVAATGVLAVAQESLALAVLGLVAAFAAPVLISTGSGDPVMLFGYFALVNLAVLGVAWNRPWVLLNRIGFAFTFIIGAWWGVLHYESARYALIQPFLAFYYGLYLLIPVLYAARAEGVRRGAVDVTLVFGLPLFAMPLQIGLLDGARLPVAFSALTLAAVHALAAADLIGKRNLRPLGDAHAGLAIGLATLAIPFAFSGSTVALIWAVEGGALVWVGLRQGSRTARWAGLVMQVLAAAAWMAATPGIGIGSTLSVAAACTGALALAGAGAFSLGWYARYGAGNILQSLLAIWAGVWWLIGGMAGIDWLVPSPHEITAVIAFLGLSALGAAAGRRLLALRAISVMAAVMAAGGLLLLPLQVALDDHPFARLGAPAWLVVLASLGWAQALLEGTRVRLMVVLLLATLVVLVPGLELAHAIGQVLNLGDGWVVAGAGLPLLVLAAALHTRRELPLASPSLPTRSRQVLDRVVWSALAGAVVVSVLFSGASRPLAFVPLFNPLELAQVAALVLLAAVSMRFVPRLRLAVALLGWMVLSVMVMRTAHQLAGVLWVPGPLLDSERVQAGLTVLWAVLGVVAWVAGSRRESRPLWLAGAVLMGVVLVKLLVIDRQYLSNAAGIVSFLAFGLLSIIVGYLAPAPPARPTGGQPREQQT